MTTALTAAIPAIVSLLGGLTGSSGKHGSTYGKNQRSLIDDLISQIKGRGNENNINQNPQFQQGQDWLSGLFNDPQFFERFEAPLQRQFQEQTIPDLANRFAGMGSGGSLGSTGFRNQLAREGSNLSTNIAALRGNMQQNAVPQLLGYAQQPFSNYMSLLNSALTPTKNTYQPPSSGFLGGLAPGITSGFAQGYGNMLGQSFGGSQSSGDSGSGYGSGWDSMFRQQGVY